MKKRLLSAITLMCILCSTLIPALPVHAENWVLASQLPAGTEVTNRKWTYTQTNTWEETTTSSSSSLSGWTKYDTKYGSWGSWSDWGNSKKTKSDTRQIETRTVYHYYRWATSKWASTGSQHQNGDTNKEKYEYLTYDQALSVKGDYTDSWKWYHDSNHNWNKDNKGSYHTVWKRTTFKTTQYRYRDRSVTYYYKRTVSNTENKESYSYPSGNGVGNVKEWVTYQYKSFTLDLNGWLDGAYAYWLSDYGTADVYINGNLVANDVNDFCNTYTYGTSYTITDVKSSAGHRYNGVYSGSWSGTITSDTSVILSFDNVTPYTVSYNANGGSNAPGNQTKIYNQSLTLSSQTPSRTGYRFVCWKDSAGNTYYPGTVYNENANLPLTAQWSEPNTFYVEYNSNGATGDKYSSSHTYDGTSYFAGSNFTKKGYTFNGWALNPEGTGTVYQPQEIVPNLVGEGTVQMYSVWKPNHYIVHYDANGGYINGDSSASMQDSELVYDELPFVLPNNQYVREGYDFKGWNIVSTSTAALYKEASKIDKNLSDGTDVTLYAIWKEIPKTEEVSFDESVNYGYTSLELTTIANNAQIYYTLDGSEPTTESNIYTEPLMFNEAGTTTIKAFALKSGSLASAVTNYTVTVGTTDNIKFAKTDTATGKDISIYLEDKNEETYRIYYTLDGSEPTQNSMIYDEPLHFNDQTNVRLKAFAVEIGCVPGEISNTTVTVGKVKNPVIEETDSWPGGTMVKISDETPNTTIYYTTDRSDPRTSSTRTQYTDEIELIVESDKPENITISAVAYKNGYAVSNVMYENIIITDRAVLEPYATLDNVIGGKMVSLDCETENVEIFYTVDGNDVLDDNGFSTSTRPYIQPFLVSENTIIKAIAVYNDSVKSPQMERSIEVQKMSKPSINVEVGEDSSVVIMSGNSTNSKIYYTLDGTMPNENALEYVRRFEVTQRTRIYAVAVRKGYATSDPAEAEAIVLTVPFPAVITNNVSDVTEYGAVLHGEITAGADSGITSRRFIYYEKNNYREINSVEADDSFSALISNLKPDTEYWYQAMAENKKGIGTGMTKSFRTAKMPVPFPTRIKLTPEFVSMNKGDKRTILATVYPSEAINKKIMWSSSDSNVVTVKNGVLTAKSNGTAIITATAMSGKVSGTMQVDVIDGTINGELDFSEISMAKNVSEIWNKNNPSQTFKVDGVSYGGNSVMATAYLARWGGTVLESRDPYPNSMNDINVRQYSSDYHVQEVLFLPPRRDSLDNNDIKKAIMEHGAVYAEFECSESCFTATRKGYLKNYYMYDSDLSHYKDAGGHAVAIVGWDDNYRARNFADTPPGDGAFICKNSWGTEDWYYKKDVDGNILSEFPPSLEKVGEDGYFYISYYDPYIGRKGINAVFNNLETNSNYNTIYQYDPLGPILCNEYRGGEVYVSNVFPQKGDVLEQDELLRAVSFYTGDKGYTYEIYVIPEFTEDDFFDNIGGFVKRGVMEYAGYHTVELDEPISLRQGTRFAVIVRLISTTGIVSTYFEAPLEKMAAQNAYAEEGQSFVSEDGIEWKDVHIESEDTNVCVKAFTDRQDDNIVLTNAINNDARQGKILTIDEALNKGFTINQDFIDEANKVSLFDNNESEFSAGAIAPSIVVGNNTVNVAEGALFDSKCDLRVQGHSVSSVKNQGGFNTCWAFATYASLESCVMRKAQGIRYYEGMSGASGESVVTYGAVDIPVSKIELNKNAISIAKDNSVTLLASITPYNATEKSIIWNSSNPEIAQVDTSGTVRALQIGETVITATNPLSGKKATCNVTVTAPQEVSGLNIPYDEVVCEEGDDIIVLHEVLPENAGNKNVVYEISNNEVAEENDGIISALSAGETTITISTEEGNYSKTVTLTVLETEKEPIVEIVDVYAEKTENGIEAEFDNVGNVDIEANIYLGVYDKETNQLISMQLINNQPIDQGDSYECIFDVALQENQIGKILVWQPENMRPYCEATIIE